MQPKLDVIGAVSQAVSAVTRNFGALILMAWPWLLVAGLGTYFSIVATAQSFGSLGGPPPAGAMVGAQLVQFGVQLLVAFAGVVLAVAWHRRVLLGETTGLALPTGFTWRYIGVALLMGLLVVLPLIAVMGIVGVVFAASGTSGAGAVAVTAGLGAVLGVIAMVVGLRCSLVLPARAIGDSALRLRDSWALTKGNTWRLIGGTLLSAIIPAIAVQLAITPFLVAGMPDLRQPDAAAAMLAYVRSLALPSALISMAYMLISVIGIGFLSFAYLHFRPAAPRSTT